MPEPGELPLGVMPGVGAADHGRLFQRDLAAQGAGSAPARHAPSSPAAADRVFAMPVPRPRPARRLAAWRRNARRSAHRARRGRARETPRANVSRRQQRRQSVAMPVGQRTPGGLDHFERARDAAAVARLQAFGRCRIALRQFGMQRLDAVALQPRAHGVADLGAESAAPPTAPASAP